ncbi:hypothetical protein L7F22_031846 [Adiantum nelumboides]|nr:hypothetical protein [Adiantum nelumboides]
MEKHELLSTAQSDTKPALPRQNLVWKQLLMSSTTLLNLSSWAPNFLIKAGPFVHNLAQVGNVRRGIASYSAQLLQPYNVRPLILHLFMSLLLLGCLASNIIYLLFKMRLYYRELPAALEAPWLLLLLACELLYFLCTLLSAVDFSVPPPLFTGASKFYSDKKEEPQYYSFSYDDDSTVQLTGTVTQPLLWTIPEKISVDDGPDDNLKAFCDSIQIESGGDQLVYLRRTKIPGVPHHFKCGNMNFGLQHSDAEYVVMMDADMILHPSFLNRVLPHIVNAPDVSFVQVPQSFYNLPVGDPLNDACGLGYDRTMVHRNTLRCPPCVGTGTIFKRKHLDKIGGFQLQSITEDTMTAYMLFNRGYKSVYVNEKLQIGITPWTFEGFVKQRQRWEKGAIQQLVSSWKSMLGNSSKLNILQKCFYFWHTGYYYMSILNVIVVVTLWTGLAFQLNFVIGEEADNRSLMSYLAIFILSWKMFWYVLWMEVSQPIQSRNRDESQFWWMAPFFFHMVVQAAFDFKSTFKFIPTSNVDCSAAAVKSPWRRKFNALKLVRVHIAFIILCGATVIVRAYPTVMRYMTITRFDFCNLLEQSFTMKFHSQYVSVCRGSGFEEARCVEGLTVVGLSVFLLTVCVHMSVPVLHILMPTGFPSAKRKSLLHYNTQGVPIFDPATIGTKWHPSVIFFELLSWLNITFWISVLYTHSTHTFTCLQESTSG